MNIQVAKTSNTFNINLKKPDNYSVRTLSGGVQVPAQFSDLSDFDASNVQDSYLVMYDAATQKYKAVSPDFVLSKSVEDSSLPADFVDQLDVDLDNKIDLDAGTF
jgi:hypothetical protein